MIFIERKENNSVQIFSSVINTNVLKHCGSEMFWAKCHYFPFFSWAARSEAPDFVCEICISISFFVVMVFEAFTKKYG